VPDLEHRVYGLSLREDILDSDDFGSVSREGRDRVLIIQDKDGDSPAPQTSSDAKARMIAPNDNRTYSFALHLYLRLRRLLLVLNSVPDYKNKGGDRVF